ncbi:hypothetical protein CPLU01_12281 [Colletotrichum plurivorum]|uniref:Uncharacterized protein n=1 Tax=Colletotrichum plurivorum TaxID=2175906 RepID=A0A8H6N715_9PEZI|nr:hypothetical protein CPLU01_12281 [Colletotrichum plurivorum]
MSITEEFEEIPHDLYKHSYQPRGHQRDKEALWNLNELYYNMGRTCASKTHGRGSWGYTVFRTVYTEESDRLFPIAMRRLERWVVQYYVHATRFPMFGEKGEKWKKADGILNDYLGSRFRLDVVEDKERLDLQDLGKASYEDIKNLCSRFREWITSVGGDPNEEFPISPRLYDFTVIDEGALRVLAALPEETPPLRVAATWEEKREWLKESDFAYMWLIDYKAVERWDGKDPLFRGWGKLEPYSISNTWFQRSSRLDRDNWVLTVHEQPKGSGDYWLVAE